MSEGVSPRSLLTPILGFSEATCALQRRLRAPAVSSMMSSLRRSVLCVS
jgi:hypothetical protein